jgi:hypothetical protein
MEPAKLKSFQDWLEKHDCYVFTLNGFPFGQFHGTRIKEGVYRPDWTEPARLEYTKRLFDLLGQLVPHDVKGSVSTLPGSFKEFISTADQTEQIYGNFWSCIEHIEACSVKYGRDLVLAIEPEPFGLWETSAEIVDFFSAMQVRRPTDFRLKKFLTVNYDTCHMAIQFEEPKEILELFAKEGISIGKIQLSSALQIKMNSAGRDQLKPFLEDDHYLHQVTVKTREGDLHHYKDLPVALQAQSHDGEEWRVHFHVPLDSEQLNHSQTTIDHLRKVIELLAVNPALCSHLEIETYTWEVLPSRIRSQTVVEQIAREYQWCFQSLESLGILPHL